MKLSHMVWGLGLCSSFALQAYESTYERIEWQQRGTDSYYCMDILDHTGVVYEPLRALVCGENLYQFSPKTFVTQTLNAPDLPEGFVFGWRIWSASGYGGEGFEGFVTVGAASASCPAAYASGTDKLSWGCRAQDSYYCVDVFNAAGEVVQAPAACGEDLHQFTPPAEWTAGNYQWKVWSPSGYAGAGFEGGFSIAGDPLVQGQALYVEHCQACHGKDVAMGLSGIGRAMYAEETRRAINNNEGGMGYLHFLSDKELEDIGTFVRDARGL